VEKQVSDLLLLRDSEYNELLGGTSEKDSQALRKAFQQNEYTCGLKNDGECVVVRALANRTRRPPNVRGPSSIVDLPPEREGQCLLTVTSLQQDPLQCIKKDATSQNSAAWQRLGFALPDSASLRRDPRGYRAQEAWARLAKMRGLRRCGLTAEGTCSSTDDPESEANGCVATMTKGGAVCVERDPAVEKVKEKKRADFSWKEAAELTSTLRNNGEMPCALNSRGDPAEHGTAPEGFCVWKDELLPKREAGGITRQTADERCVGTLEPKTGPVCLRSVASVVETMRRLSAQARRLDAARRTNV
jgi:hypothetical protein